MSTSRDDAGRPSHGPGFGRYLQSARLERGIRLEHVAEETRISLGTLEAIESEDFDRLPPDVFLKGFLRAFARAVGADAREALARYHERRRVRESEPEAPPAAAERSGGGWKLVLLLLLLAGLIAMSVLAYQYWSQRRAAQIFVPAPAAAAPSTVPAPPSEAAKRPKMPAIPRHVLVISAHDQVSVKVSIDQGTPSEYHLKAGGQLRLEAGSGFNLLVGNAAGLKLTLDDKPVPVPGKRGEVVNLQLP
jgi:transcriptional regulator with XRE-family HTH domain